MKRATDLFSTIGAAVGAAPRSFGAYDTPAVEGLHRVFLMPLCHIWPGNVTGLS